MIRLFTFLSMLGLLTIAQAQTAQWTWMAGDNLPNQPSVYGTQGTYAATNTPGGIRDGLTWTNADGTLWLYGGYGLGESGTTGYLMSMWQLAPQTGQWRWVSGPKEALAMAPAPVYGMKGVTTSFVHPGGSRLGAVTWIDASGNLWLYGGHFGGGRMNDLWKYSITTNMWTWIAGDNTPSQFGVFYHPAVYGTRGVPAPENKPGPRSGATGWVDKEGNLWLFGGIGWSPNNSFGDLNDLWKYNPATNMWAWMSGGGGVFQYGRPGARTGAMGTTDAEGNFWLFGGFGASQYFFQRQLDDLWKYNPTTGTWTWMSGDLKNYTGPDGGSLAYMQSTIYGTKGVADPLNKPGPYFGSITTDKNGTLWLMGRDELWKFDPATTHWTWMETMATANYGTKGVTAPANKPSARRGAMLWTDAQNRTWLLGGVHTASMGTIEYLNDLWNLSIVTPPVVLSCTPSKAVSASTNACAAVVTGIDPVLTPAGTATVNYTLSGATTGTGTGSVSGSSFNKGVTTVMYTLAGTAQTCSFTITVTDNVAPVLSTISTSATTLWPANHSMTEVKLYYTGTDNCAVNRTEVSVSSNEPQNGLGDGDTPNDWEVIDHHTVRLRAERSGKGNGRVYTVWVKMWDEAGNESNNSTTVIVPKKAGGPKQVKPVAGENGVGAFEVANGLIVKALPSVSSNYFTLVIQSSLPAPVTVRVLDEKGRLVEAQGNKSANGTLTIGQNYRPGVYYAEVVQGEKKKVLTLIKQ